MTVTQANLNTYNQGDYIYNFYAKNLDMDKSSFTVVKDGETYNMPMKNYQYPNELGFEGGYYREDSTSTNLSIDLQDHGVWKRQASLSLTVLRLTL